MKRIIKFLFLLASALLLLGPATTVVVSAFVEHPVVSIMASMGIAYLAYNTPKVQLPGMVRNGIQVEIWTQYISDNLFKGVEFLKNCFRADEYVLNGRVVHIPQAGAVPVVTKNRNSTPITAPVAVVQRTDVDVTYSIDEYTTAPSLIPDADKVELSYNKMDSLLSSHVGSLNETIADNILVQWSPSLLANIVKTSGSSIAAHVANATAATGTRSAFTTADLKAAKVKLDKQKVSKLNRYALMSSDMWSQLESNLSVTTNRDFSKYVDAARGEIMSLYGFEIIVTPNMPTYNSASTPVVQAFGYVGATTDCDGVLCYQKDCLELALGEIKFFENANDPTYYGDVYSALVRMGGRKRYSTAHTTVNLREAGVVAIVQNWLT